MILMSLVVKTIGKIRQEVLEEYGGGMSEDEFQRKVQRLETVSEEVKGINAEVQGAI